jgi:hypothetical protein
MGRAKLLYVLLIFGLSGCFGSGNSEQQVVENDWINESLVPGPSPTPTPTASPSPTPTPTDVQLYTGPEEVEKYVLKFVDDAKIQGLDVLPDMKNPMLEIRIASLDAYGGSVIGLCETGGSKRRVTFDPDFWNTVSETQRELLAHHEFGHCVLYRNHRSDVLSSGIYASIMYPVIMSSSTYTNNYNYYLDELFTWGALSLSTENVQGERAHICDHDNMYQRTP